MSNVEHNHEVEEDVQEEWPIFMNSDGEPGFLIKNGLNHHFVNAKGEHVSIHIWRFR